VLPAARSARSAPAVAPEAVFTVRTYGDTSPPYDPKTTTISAQIHTNPTTSPLVNGAQPTGSADREPSQVAHQNAYS